MLFEETKETRVCSKCGEEKSLSEFTVATTKKKKYYNKYCKECSNEQSRKYRVKKRLEKGFELYESGKFAKIKRKYKKILPATDIKVCRVRDSLHCKR